MPRDLVHIDDPPDQGVLAPLERPLLADRLLYVLPTATPSISANTAEGARDSIPKSTSSPTANASPQHAHSHSDSHTRTIQPRYPGRPIPPPNLYTAWPARSVGPPRHNRAGRSAPIQLRYQETTMTRTKSPLSCPETRWLAIASLVGVLISAVGVAMNIIIASSASAPPSQLEAAGAFTTVGIVITVFFASATTRRMR